MFWKRNWPLLLLSLLSFISFGVLVWLKPFGDGYAETYSSSVAHQLPETQNQDEPMVRTAQEESLAPEAGSGAGASLVPQTTPTLDETTGQGESQVPSATSSITDANGSSGSSVMYSTGGSATPASGGVLHPAPQPSIATPGINVVYGAPVFSPSGVSMPTGIIIPVADPAPVEIPPQVTETPFEPLGESTFDPSPQPKGNCTCQTSWK
jgi:hypothetical protein